MVSVGFVCIVFVFGASTAVMPLIYGPVMDEFGWSRTEATLMFTYKNATSAVIALFLLGPMLERLGLRTVMLGSFVVTGIGMGSFVWIDSLWSYYLAGSIMGLGITTTIIGTNVFVSRWFVRNQGLAVGITLAGTSAGGMFFPFLAAALIDAFGWRFALASLSLGIWGIALPLYLWKAEENPSEADVLQETGPDLPDAGSRRGIGAAELDGKFADLLRGSTFWAIAASLLIVAAADAGVFQHTALFLERDAGLSSTLAAASISGTFGLGIIAKIGAGKFYDALSIRGVSIWYVLLAVSIALAFPVSGILTLALFTAVRGIAHGGVVPETAIVAKHCYGPRLMNMTLPVFTGIWAVGAGLGPVLLSLFYDTLGSYRGGLVLFIVLCLAAAALMCKVQPFYRERLDARAENG